MRFPAARCTYLKRLGIAAECCSRDWRLHEEQKTPSPLQHISRWQVLQLADTCFSP